MTSFRYALTVDEKFYEDVELSTPLHVGDEVCLPYKRVKVRLIRHIVTFKENKMNGFIKEVTCPTVLVEVMNERRG